MPTLEIDNQYRTDLDWYFNNLEFSAWYRYYYIIKDILEAKPKSVLEIGVGNGIVKNCIKPKVSDYIVLDINSQLMPDICSDLRNQKSELKNKFDIVVCSEVLEHMPFTDIEKSILNMRSYLKDSGMIILTLPHRRAHLLFLSSYSYEKHKLFTFPSGFGNWKTFTSKYLYKKEYMDPHHYWEIGVNKLSRKEVEGKITSCQLIISNYKKLLTVDYWLINKIGL